MLSVRTEIRKKAGHQELKASASHRVTETEVVQELGQLEGVMKYNRCMQVLRNMAYHASELSHTIGRDIARRKGPAK